MGKERTPAQVAAEIKALEACKGYIPPRTAFGDDNIRGVDLQIKFLKGEIDTTAGEFYEDYTQDEQSTILEAQYWLEGDQKESPASGWDSYKPRVKAALVEAKPVSKCATPSCKCNARRKK